MDVVFVGCISAGILSEVGRAVRLPWFSVNQKMRYSQSFHIINSSPFIFYFWRQYFKIHHFARLTFRTRFKIQELEESNPIEHASLVCTVWAHNLSRAVENAESARSVIYAIFSAHSAYFNVSRQKVPYFNVSRQNRVVFKTVLQQNNVEAC